MALMTAVDGLMNGMSGTVQADRQRQERMAKETCDRIERVEENFFHNFRIFLLDVSTCYYVASENLFGKLCLYNFVIKSKNEG